MPREATIESVEIFLRHSAPMRFVRRVLHAFIYHTRVRPAITRTDVFSMCDLLLSVPPTVFHPRFYLTSRFFAGSLETMSLQEKKLLEVGCGSGLLSLVAARAGAEVTALDINPSAVECTAHNASVNGLSVRTLQSDLFQGLDAEASFDTIIWSPPFYPRATTDAASHAWNAGVGFEVIKRFARHAARHLRPGGNIILLLSSETDIPMLLSIFASSGFAAAILTKKRKLFETLSLYTFTPSRRCS